MIIALQGQGELSKVEILIESDIKVLIKMITASLKKIVEEKNEIEIQIPGADEHDHSKLALGWAE